MCPHLGVVQPLSGRYWANYISMLCFYFPFQNADKIYALVKIDIKRIV